MKKLYQDSPWHVRLWRRRHYLRIPFQAAGIKWRHPEDSWRFAWSLAKGIAQSRMNWTYPFDLSSLDESED